MAVKIDFANEADFKPIRFIDPHATFIDPQKIKTKISQKEIILGKVQGKIVGLIRFSYIWSTRPYLDFIWVEDNSRGQGIGTKLLSFLEDHLGKEGHAYLHSSTEKGNKAGMKWHKKQGFVRCGSNKALNLPQDKTEELFWFKRIGGTKSIALKRYPLV